MVARLARKAEALDPFSCGVEGREGNGESEDRHNRQKRPLEALDFEIGFVGVPSLVPEVVVRVTETGLGLGWAETPLQAKALDPLLALTSLAADPAFPDPAFPDRIHESFSN